MANASVLGNISNFTIGNAIVIPITKYVSSYSDTLNIYCGNTWIKRVQGLTNNQVITFESSELAQIYSTMSNVQNALFKFHNTTYNGANIVGTSEKYATGTINANIKPTISSVSFTDSNASITSQFGGFLQNKTSLYAAISATAGTGSSMSAYYTDIGSHSYTGAAFTSSVITASGQVQYSVSAVDARGRAGTSTGTITVIPYDSPSISTFKVTRCDTYGNADIYGTYAKVEIDASISPANNRNTKSFTIAYKRKSDNTWTTLATYNSSYTYEHTAIYSGFNSDYSYDFKAVATDFFGNVESFVDVSTGFALLDFKANGKGIGIGKVVSRDALQIGIPIYDRFDTAIGNGLALYEGGGVTNPNTTIEELILTSTNTPTTALYYVRTFFYSTKSATSNRTQVAYPYSYNAAGINSSKVFVRIYVNGTGWGNWNPIGMSGKSVNYSGLFDVGNLRIETGWVSVSPVANAPTTIRVTFANTFKTIPIVTPTVSSNGYGNQVLGCYTNGITTTYADIVLLRTNSVATNVYYTVVGEI